MKKTFLLGLLATGLASAAPIGVYFNFSGSAGDGTIGNSMTFTAMDYNTNLPVGLTATVRAYGTGDSTTNTNGTTLRDAALGQYSSGLGVCDGIEQGSVSGFSATRPCSDPHHKIDNINSFNFVLIEFNFVVTDPAWVDLGAVGSDSDASYWWGANVPATIVGTNPTTAAGRQDQSNLGSSWAQLTNATGASTRLLFGAYVPGTDLDDSFKLTKLYVKWEETLDDNPVPEPASLGLMGVALVGLGMIRRARKA